MSLHFTCRLCFQKAFPTWAVRQIHLADFLDPVGIASTTQHHVVLGNQPPFDTTRFSISPQNLVEVICEFVALDTEGWCAEKSSAHRPAKPIKRH
ncbi:unnamed protein product [Protopolystoma xenopodis]|uniref:Uncharacterized protein n=1 Tax=Protopolystoma xenopodis TaxID=117903 RepID=A0A448WLH2_9PLAT|nr:unnamed protein product [Protopolystoma xenopodis]